MIKSILFIFFSILTIQKCLSQENLYLYFDNNSKNMNKVRMGKDKPFNYRFIFGEYDINLTSDLSISYKPIQIDTIPMKNIDTIKLRNYEWLSEFIKSYKDPYFINFYDIFNNMSVVEIDSINKKVIISKVLFVIYEE